MATTHIAIIKTLRPRQWLKNLTLYAGILYTGRMFVVLDFVTVTAAFIIFCMVTSSVYVFNDIIDAPKDRLHPFKKKRPIASGALPVRHAYILGIFLMAIASIFAIWLSPRFFLSVFAYIILQFAYMNYLKHVIILDVIAIASGFLLRIYAGVWVIGTHLNIWFLLSVISFALFIATGKRRAEATLLQAYSDKSNMGRVRSTLTHYPESLLHSYTTMFATATWMTYSFFAFLQPAITPNAFFLNFLYSFIPRRADTKWLMATIPFVIYGVMRYLYLIFEKKEGESPERIVLSDKPLLVTVLGWFFVTFAVLYVLSG
ncbi:MAG: decaprenyl-phosphate phosphoribosyltransferase [bacterium]|nr:decaprenyl-phosphate phosphoribosyltransferase [bacterium]